MTVIDAHTHFIPASLAKEASRRPEWGIEITTRDGGRWVTHEQGFSYPLDETFFGGEAKLRDMDSRGLDMSVMSISPTLFFYWIGATDGASFARYANDALAETIQQSDGRFAGVATLPMQDPEAAAEELRRGVEELSLRGAHIGTSVEGAHLDEARFAPVLEAADALGVPLIVHPYYVGPRPGLEQFYLTNIFGNPLDTALCASRLIFSGTFETFANLKVMLVHAGGFLPYQIGRLDHGWDVRPEPKVQLDRPPSECLDRFFYDRSPTTTPRWRGSCSWSATTGWFWAPTCPTTWEIRIPSAGWPGSSWRPNPPSGWRAPTRRSSSTSRP